MDQVHLVLKVLEDPLGQFSRFEPAVHADFRGQTDQKMEVGSFLVEHGLEISVDLRHYLNQPFFLPSPAAATVCGSGAPPFRIRSRYCELVIAASAVSCETLPASKRTWAAWKKTSERS